MRLTQVLYLFTALLVSLSASAEIGSRSATNKQPQRGNRKGGGGGGGADSSIGLHKGAPQSGGRSSKDRHSPKGVGKDKDGGGAGKRPMVWLNFTEANKQIDWLIKKKYKKAKAALKKQRKPTKDQAKQKACHSLAMLRCGCTALGNYESELNRSKTVPLETKCAIRKNFFRCLDESESVTHCRHANNNKALKPKKTYRLHMKEIVSVLWSTRGCLLGADDGVPRSHVNSAFCAKINGSGGAADGAKAKGNKSKSKVKVAVS